MTTSAKVWLPTPARNSREQQGREQVRSTEYLLHADRERRAEPARDTMRCWRCRQFVPLVTHLCPAEMDQLREVARLLAVGKGLTARQLALQFFPNASDDPPAAARDGAE